MEIYAAANIYALILTERRDQTATVRAIGDGIYNGARDKAPVCTAHKGLWLNKTDFILFSLRLSSQ
jgi:hypothetical protein